jgi:cytochrome P450
MWHLDLASWQHRVVTMSEAVAFNFARTRVGQFDLPAEVAALRESLPIAPMRYPSGRLGWVVTSHDLARQVLSDSRFTHSLAVGDIPSLHQGQPMPPMPQTPGMFLHMDPPDHTRYRKMLTGRFTVRRAQDAEPGLAAIVADGIKALRAHGSPVDLVTAYARPVATRTVCEILGIPYEDRAHFEDFPEVAHNPDSTMEQQGAMYFQLHGYLHGLFARKRAEPGDDLISTLLTSGDVTDDELFNMVMLIYIAGVATTESALGLSIFALLRRPGQLAALRADPALIGNGVDELLRYLTINHSEIFRTATESVELGGVTVQEGQTVTVSLPAANRDPQKFARPDDLDVTRTTSGHLAWGYGVHQCLGQNFARSLLVLSASALITEFPDLDAAPEQAELRFDRSLFGLGSLPVTFS